jgi:hypothetical protein
MRKTLEVSVPCQGCQGCQGCSYRANAKMVKRHGDGEASFSGSNAKFPYGTLYSTVLRTRLASLSVLEPEKSNIIRHHWMPQNERAEGFERRLVVGRMALQFSNHRPTYRPPVLTTTLESSPTFITCRRIHSKRTSSHATEPSKKRDLRPSATMVPASWISPQKTQRLRPRHHGGCCITYQRGSEGGRQ